MEESRQEWFCRMYSPRVHRVSHTMNKSSIDLNQTVKSLVTAVNQLTQNSSQGRNSPNKKKNRRTGSNRNQKGSRSQNPSGNASRLPAKPLLLNQDQTMSVTPASYWTRTLASTPGGDRIKAQEMIGSLVLTADSTGTFSPLNVITILGGVTQLPLSPIYVPRLSQIASTFEFYKFHSATVTFAPLSATTVSGRLFQCCDYDAKDQYPVSSVSMMSNISSATSQIYAHSNYKVRSDLSRLPRYVVREANASDINQTWQANLDFAVEGFTGTTGQSLGYVFIEYDIEFFTPSQIQQ